MQHNGDSLVRCGMSTKPTHNSNTGCALRVSSVAHINHPLVSSKYSVLIANRLQENCVPIKGIKHDKFHIRPLSHVYSSCLLQGYRVFDPTLG